MPPNPMQFDIDIDEPLTIGELNNYKGFKMFMEDHHIPVEDWPVMHGRMWHKRGYMDCVEVSQELEVSPWNSAQRVTQSMGVGMTIGMLWTQPQVGVLMLSVGILLFAVDQLWMSKQK